MTGTHRGAMAAQLHTLRERLDARRALVVVHRDLYQGIFHHGDCVGADVQAAAIARDLGYYIVGHPPVDAKRRAFFPSDQTVDPREYLARNRDIVDAVRAGCGVLYALPYEAAEIVRSGTWSTVRYARKTGCAGEIIFPLPPWPGNAL